MNENGGNILKATREMRNFFEDIGLLLLSGSELLSEEDWMPTGSIAIAGGSSTINSPSYWLPQDAFRFFKHKEKQHIICYISVIIDDLNNQFSLSEPLITSGWINYGSGNQVGNNWAYSFSRMALQSTKWSDEGIMMEIPKEVVEHDNRTVLRARAMALPLTKIVNVSTLENFVTKLLLEDMFKLDT